MANDNTKVNRSKGHWTLTTILKKNHQQPKTNPTVCLLHGKMNDKMVREMQRIQLQYV